MSQRVALVTGAASGIGRALSPLLAAAGMRLVLLDRDAQGLSSLADGLVADHATCVTAVADVTDRRALREAVDAASGRLGAVDLVIACAGITDVTLMGELDTARLERLITVNLLGVAYTIDAVLPEMLRRGSGHIVGISSLAGQRGMPFSAGYSASKAALTRYLEGLRASLRRRGIVVTTVCPGFVRTPLMEGARYRPQIPMIEPEVAARHVLRAIRHRRRLYAFPLGASLTVRFLGWLPPACYDRLMARVAARSPELEY